MYPESLTALAEKLQIRNRLFNEIQRHYQAMPHYNLNQLVDGRYRMILRIVHEEKPLDPSQELNLLAETLIKEYQSL